MAFRVSILTSSLSLSSQNSSNSRLRQLWWAAISARLYPRLFDMVERTLLPVDPGELDQWVTHDHVLPLECGFRLLRIPGHGVLHQPGDVAVGGARFGPHRHAHPLGHRPSHRGLVLD